MRHSLKLLTFVFCVLLFSSSAFSQSVSEKLYTDTSTNSGGFIQNMIHNSDGSMTFCGFYGESGIPEAFMMKLNSDYSIRWAKTYQRHDSTNFSFYEIFSINDTAYFVSFCDVPNSNEVHGFVVIDSAGNILYGKKLIDTTQSFNGWITDICQGNDSTYLFSVKSGPGSGLKSILLKVNLHGNIIEQKTFDDSHPGYGTSILKLLDGNFLYVTLDESFYIFNLHCFDSNLDTVWNKGYNEGPYWTAWRPNWIMQIPDSSLLIMGMKNTNAGSGNYQPTISKFTSDGEMLWSKKYTDPDSTHVNAGFIGGNELNGKIYMSMSMWRSTGIPVDIIVFDTAGQVLSNQTYGNGEEIFSTFMNIHNDSLLIPINTINQLSQFGFILIDTNLVTLCSTSDFTFSVDTMNPVPFNIVTFTNSTLALTDFSETFTMNTPVFNESLFCMQTGTSEMKRDVLHVYPNPASDIIHIVLPENISNMKLKITDIYGRIIFEKAAIESSDLFVDVANFMTGLYFATIRSNGFGKTISFVKM